MRVFVFGVISVLCLTLGACQPTAAPPAKPVTETPAPAEARKSSVANAAAEPRPTPPENEYRVPGHDNAFWVGKLSMLQSPDVHADLNLTQDQVEKLRDLARGLHQAYGDLPEKEPARARKITELAKVAAQREQQALKVLTPAQVKRLEQIDFQQPNDLALLTPKVAATLKITKEQERKLQEIRRQAAERLKVILVPGAAPKPEVLLMHREKTVEAMLTVLTPEQRAQWKERAGKPFQGMLDNCGFFQSDGLLDPSK